MVGLFSVLVRSLTNESSGGHLIDFFTKLIMPPTVLVAGTTHFFFFIIGVLPVDLSNISTITCTIIEELRQQKETPYITKVYPAMKHSFNIRDLLEVLPLYIYKTQY